MIRTIDVMDEYLCGAQCFMEPNCVSYNLKDSLFVPYKCDLNNSTHYRHPDSLKIQNGSKYRGTKVGIKNSNKVYSISIITSHGQNSSHTLPNFHLFKVP